MLFIRIFQSPHSAPSNHSAVPHSPVAPHNVQQHPSAPVHSAPTHNSVPHPQQAQTAGGHPGQHQVHANQQNSPSQNPNMNQIPPSGPPPHSQVRNT